MIKIKGDQEGLEKPHPSMSVRTVRLPDYLWARLEKFTSEVKLSHHQRISISSLMRHFLEKGLASSTIDVLAEIDAGIRKTAEAGIFKTSSPASKPLTSVKEPLGNEEDFFTKFQEYVKRGDYSCAFVVRQNPSLNKSQVASFYYRGDVPLGEDGDNFKNAIRMWMSE